MCQMERQPVRMLQTVHPFEMFGEETIRYTTVTSLSNALHPRPTEVGVVRYGDLVIMHAYLADDPSKLEQEYLPLMLEEAEAKLHYGLR